MLYNLPFVPNMDVMLYNLPFVPNMDVMLYNLPFIRNMDRIKQTDREIKLAYSMLKWNVEIIE